MKKKFRFFGNLRLCCCAVLVMCMFLPGQALTEVLDDYLINGSFYDYEVKIGSRTYPLAAYGDYFDGILSIDDSGAIELPKTQWFSLEFVEGENGLELRYEYAEEMDNTDFLAISHEDWYNPGFTVLPNTFDTDTNFASDGTYIGTYINDNIELFLDYETGISSGDVNVRTDTITVPYGRFSCYRIHYSGNYSVPGKSGQHNITFYLVKGLGLIRLDYDARDMNYSLRLVDVSLGPYIPKQPEILAPATGETVPVTPELRSSDYRILEGGGTHYTTQWQILEAATDDFVWAVVDDDGDLITEPVPPGVLDYDTEYYVRVNYQSADFQESAWSEPVFFRTETTQHEVIFNLGDHGTYAGGGPLTQYVWHRDPALEPRVLADEGWQFAGWDPVLPAAITAPWTGGAVYDDIGVPELTVEPREILLTLNNPLPDLLQGVSAMDNGDGDISASVVATGAPDMSQTGSYQIAYQVTDSSGNISSERVRLYTVVPTAPSWTFDLFIGAPSRAGDTLHLGTHETATDTINDGMDTVAAPPAEGPWIRLMDPDTGTELTADYRAIGPQKDFIVAVQAGADNPLTIGWDTSLLPVDMRASLWQTELPATRESVSGNPVGNTFLDMARTHELTVPSGTFRQFVIRVSTDLTVDCRLRKGWNLIHLPITPNFGSASLVFPEWETDPETGQVFSFWLWQDGRFHRHADSLAANHVYWIYSPASGVFLIRGMPADLTSWQLTAGWNVLGAPYPMTLPDLGELDAPVWGYDNQSARFIPGTAITAQSAVWINAPTSRTIPLADR